MHRQLSLVISLKKIYVTILVIASLNTTFWILMDICVCYWPPVRVVCPNHEVLEFQPRIWTTSDLGSVDIFTTWNLELPPHLFQTFSSIVLVPFSILPPPPSADFHRRRPLYVFQLLPTSSPRAKRHPPRHFPHTQPAILRRSSLTTRKEGSISRYIKILYEDHKIGLLKICGNQYCGDSSSYITRAIFAQFIFSIPVMNN